METMATPVHTLRRIYWHNAISRSTLFLRAKGPFLDKGNSRMLLLYYNVLLYHDFRARKQIRTRIMVIRPGKGEKEHGKTEKEASYTGRCGGDRRHRIIDGVSYSRAVADAARGANMARCALRHSLRFSQADLRAPARNLLE